MTSEEKQKRPCRLKVIDMGQGLSCSTVGNDQYTRFGKPHLQVVTYIHSILYF